MLVNQLLQELKNNDFEIPGFVTDESLANSNLREEIKIVIGNRDGCYRQIKNKECPTRFMIAVFDEILVIWMVNHKVVNQVIDLVDIDQDISYLLLKYGKVFQENILV